MCNILWWWVVQRVCVPAIGCNLRWPVGSLASPPLTALCLEGASSTLLLTQPKTIHPFYLCHLWPKPSPATITGQYCAMLSHNISQTQFYSQWKTHPKQVEMISDGFRSTRQDVDINREGPDVLKQCISLKHIVTTKIFNLKVFRIETEKMSLCPLQLYKKWKIWTCGLQQKVSQMELTLHSNIYLQPLRCNTIVVWACFKAVK